MNSNLLGDNEQLQSNQNNEIKLMNKSRKYLLYASFLLILLSISAFIAHLIVADSLTTYIKTNYAFSIWWSFFNMNVQIYLLYDLYFRFDNENQSFISLKNTDRIIRTVKFSLIGILSFASFISCATINEIAGVWAFFAFISSTLINIICFLNAEGDESRSRNPFEKIENKCLKLMIVWVFYTIFWLIFLILLLLASINVIRISYDINFNYKPEGKYANNIYYNCKGEGSPTVILLGGGSVPFAQGIKKLRSCTEMFSEISQRLKGECSSRCCMSTPITTPPPRTNTDSTSSSRLRRGGRSLGISGSCGKCSTWKTCSVKTRYKSRIRMVASSSIPTAGCSTR